jgi:hypothetical protein
MGHARGRRLLREVVKGAGNDANNILRRLLIVHDKFAEYDRPPPDGTEELVKMAVCMKEAIWAYYKGL